MAHADLDRLMDFCIRFAQGMLAKQGAFYPFGALVKSTGELQPLAVDSGQENPLPQALVQELTAALQNLAARGEADALALCYDSRLSAAGPQKSETEAIAVDLEHRDAESLIVYLPYGKDDSGKFTYDDPVAVKKPRKFFR